MIKTHSKTFAATYLQLKYLRALELEKHSAKCFENSAVDLTQANCTNWLNYINTDSVSLLTDNYIKELLS